jgi:multiple sugar transport system substrate-binding protein
MITVAKRLKDEGKPYRIVFTGAQYEGLVVTYNSLVASYGGQILSEDGKKVVMDAGAVDALKLLKQVATEGVTDPSLTNAQEQQVQQAFEAKDSKAAFELNWPYVYAAMQSGNPDRAKHFKWAPYPGIDGPGKATVGGYDLAVSAYSQHKPEAFEAALCLRSAESQRYSAINDGVPPTIESVYDDGDADFVKAYPMWQTIRDELQDATVRPLTVVYQNLSTITSKVLSPPQNIDPKSTADELRDQLQKALDSKGVLP